MADSIEPEAPNTGAVTPAPPLPLSSLMVRRDTQIWLAIFVIGGLAIGAVLFPSEWSIPKRILGGLLLGSGSMFCLFLPRMIGGHDYN